MGLRSTGMFLLLLSVLRAGVQEKKVRAMVGSKVELGCLGPEGSSFNLSDLMVYWQVSGSKTVVAYYFPENSSAVHQDSRYRNRAHLSPAAMRQGDFSLHLFNVTPQDAQTFHCLVFCKATLEEVLKVVVTLHVAANYSMPVVSSPAVSSPGAVSQGSELTFTCTSTNGYPAPRVYWINRTDGSLLDKALQNSTVSLNARGLYDVVSVLTVPHSPHVDVGCCIENTLLHQTLTVGSQPESVVGVTDRITEHPASPAEERGASVLVILAVLCVVVAVAVGWVCRSRCPRGYTGAQVMTVLHQLPDRT
ncbi:ICOS ligand [Ochotona princeps]|uniref:ICOS ligand n=1 Tax=Ochotona princeps TaxID=9978 RepID=UPI00271516EB|nr:ICOS ligand [Ochotona princeps]